MEIGSQEDDFKQRFIKIKGIFIDFHRQFVQTNTIHDDDPQMLNGMLPKFQRIYDTLLHFLAHCLQNETCDPLTIDSIILTNSHILRDETSPNGSSLRNDQLGIELRTLLHKLCPLMNPWDANMNAQFTHLCKQFIEHPFSINASHRVDGEET
jgi:hypothetical protein